MEVEVEEIEQQMWMSDYEKTIVLDSKMMP